MYLRLAVLKLCAFPQDDKKLIAFLVSAGGRNNK
jgi:hypothetical protein